MNTRLLKKLRKKFAKEYYSTPCSDEFHKSKVWYGKQCHDFFAGGDKEYNEKYIAYMVRCDIRRWIDKHYPRRHKTYYYPW